MLADMLADVKLSKRAIIEDNLSEYNIALVMQADNID